LHKVAASYSRILEFYLNYHSFPQKVKKETKEWTIKLGRFEAELAGLNKKRSNETATILQLQG
jgi:hypothetical protein